MHCSTGSAGIAVAPVALEHAELARNTRFRQSCMVTDKIQFWTACVCLVPMRNVFVCYGQISSRCTLRMGSVGAATGASSELQILVPMLGENAGPESCTCKKFSGCTHMLMHMYVDTCRHSPILRPGAPQNLRKLWVCACRDVA